MKTIYEQYAKVLIHYSLEMKKGQRLLILSSYLAEPLLRECYREALKAGAFPELRVGINGTEKIFYDCAGKEQLEYISPLTRYVYENYDALLHVEALFNVKELQNVDPAKKQQVSIAKTELNKIFMKRAADESLRWTLCVFPTDSMAQEAGMSRGEYEEFVYSACFLYDDDPVARWNKLKDDQQRVVDFLNKKTNIRFAADDVAISFSTEGKKWINSGGTCNMPSGEVFTAPLEDSVNGRIRFSYPGIYLGQEIEDIMLEVKGGEVVGWEAKKGKALLDKIMEIPGARRFGEVAVGTNYGITKFTRNMLFDEKIGGTIHMAVGAAYPETGGTNESSVHWDLLANMKTNGRIYADDELIYKDGKFII
ncbi:MAG: aminopeptidase [Sedimentisphaerales bacterium]|nr:aminopeptidase [Sedimentisphaerales bacterium]